MVLREILNETPMGSDPPSTVLVICEKAGTPSCLET
jgi:hypothetical protein